MNPKQKIKKEGNSLRWLLFKWISVSFFLVFLVLGFVYIKWNHQILMDDAKAFEEEKYKLTQGIISNYLKIPFGHIVKLKKRIITENDDEKRKSLNNFLAFTKEFQEVWCADSNGLIQLWGGDKPHLMDRSGMLGKTFPLGGKDSIFVSGTFYSSEREQIEVLIVLKGQGRNLGASLSLDYLSAELEKNLLDNKDFLRVIDQNGVYIYHNNKEFTQQRKNAPKVIRELSGYSEYQENGKNYHLYSKVDKQFPWKVIVGFKDDLIIAKVRNLIYVNIVILIVFFLVLYIVVTRLTFRVSEPLNDLVNQSRNVGGNSNIEIQLKGDKVYNELQLLAEAFNSSISRINHRENELRAVNEVLEDELNIRQQEQNAMELIVRATATITDHELFEYSVKELGAWLKVDKVILLSESSSSLKVIASYSPYHEQQKEIPDGVAQFFQKPKGDFEFKFKEKARFPSDKEWLGFIPQSLYFRYLVNDFNETVGVLLVAHSGPFSPPNRFHEVLQVLGDRIAKDLHKLNVEKEKDSLREQLNQSQKMEALGVLAGGVAHDFNNLLTSIGGYTEMLLEECTVDQKDFANNILSGVKKAASLTRQLLSFSRKDVVKSKSIAITPFLEKNQKLFRSLVAEDIELEYLEKTELTILGDETHLEQVLMNLCVNAADAIKDSADSAKSPKKIRFCVESEILAQAKLVGNELLKPGEYAKFVVSDTGAGIPEDVVDNIFEPFFTTKEQNKGTGLGLSTVYGILKQHGGSIEIYETNSQGTTFHFYWPVAKSVVEARGSKLMSSSKGIEGAKILLVEDEDYLRRMAGLYLKQAGCTVTACKDGDHALEQLSEKGDNFDLMLTDLVMPGMSGKELIDQVRDEYPQMKILLMSGYIPENESVLLEDIPLLSKPFKMSDLADSIKQFI